MRPYPVVLLLSSSIVLCLGGGWAWGETDKSSVDLERGPAALAARYARPRGAQVYRYDKTELDVATPLTEQANEVPGTRSSPNSTSEVTPTPAPQKRSTTLSPSTP